MEPPTSLVSVCGILFGQRLHTLNAQLERLKSGTWESPNPETRLEKEWDRLATTNKAFHDPNHPILALRTKVEDLRLKLFWKHHCVQDLKAAIHKAKKPCKCWKCTIYTTVNTDNKGCDFIPRFQAAMAQCGITYTDMPPPHAHVLHMSNMEGLVCEVDAHFVEPQLTSGFFRNINYGTKLTRAKSVDSPELKKLATLFKIMFD
jgi:hypothetical protein